MSLDPLSAIVNSFKKDEHKPVVALSMIGVVALSLFFYTGMSLLSSEFFIKAETFTKIVISLSLGTFQFSILAILLIPKEGFKDNTIISLMILTSIAGMFSSGAVISVMYIINKLSGKHCCTFTMCSLFIFGGIFISMVFKIASFGKEDK